ncbi:unnamed protein product [Heterobilharzia americana]|nr:unnamed protein product [Heterobilharzia americana]
MAGLFAHEHVDSFRLLVTKSNISVASLFLMPSISPLLLNGLGDFNPRIRLYRYKRSTMKLLGYAQYYFNLEKQLSLINHSILNNWQLEYDTLTTYHMNDLSPRSLTILYNNFMKEDNNYWSYYWQYELGGRQHLSFQSNYLTNDTGLCPRVKSQCRCDHLCAIRNLLLNNLIECLQLCKDINYTLHNNNGDNVLHNSLLTVILSDHINYSIYLNRSIINQISITNSSERSSLPYIIGVIVAFLVILIGIVLIVNREVCNRHRGYQQRRSLLTSIIHGGGGGALNTLNGGLPITSFLQGTRTPRTTTNNNGGGGVKSTRINDHYGIGGSCIELHTSFNPSYDNLYPYYFNKSMSSLNGHDFSNTDGRGRRGDDDDDDDSGRNHKQMLLSINMVLLVMVYHQKFYHQRI